MSRCRTSIDVLGKFGRCRSQLAPLRSLRVLVIIGCADGITIALMLLTFASRRRFGATLGLYRGLREDAFWLDG